MSKRTLPTSQPTQNVLFRRAARQPQSRGGPQGTGSLAQRKRCCWTAGGAANKSGAEGNYQDAGRRFGTGQAHQGRKGGMWLIRR